MFFDQRKLTPQEIELKERDFSDLIMDPVGSAIVWKQMRDFFASNSPEDYKYSYWRWFVDLTWYRLNVVSKEEIVDIVANQAPSALLQNYNAQDEIMWYLGMRVIDELEMRALYLKMQEAFLESEAVVGKWQGKNVTVAELVKEIDSVYKTGDSLAQADFESRLRQIMFPDEMTKRYFTADPEDAKERFLDLVSFFKTFTQENIWYVVDAFLNPEKYQNVARGEASLATVSTVSAIPPVAPPTPAPKPVVPPQPVAKPAIPPKPTPQQIKSQIESQFKKDADGNFTDIEGVMAKLSELAEKNNDPKIAEMMYYDEKDNKFKWNL